MSKARPIVAGASYLITRRCVQRQFWLLPTELTTQIIQFCVGVAAKRFGIAVHAVTAMSNHVHIVATDTDGRLPDFSQWVFEFVCKAVNASYGRWGSLFEQAEEPSYVRLTTAEAIIDAIAYTVANPVEAGLVEYSRAWPGWCQAFSAGYGNVRVVKRPTVFFRQGGAVVEETTVRMTRPPGFEGLSDRDVADRIRHACIARERSCRAEHREQAREFLGKRHVLAQKPWQSAHSYEQKRTLSPRVAGTNKWARIEALTDFKRFRQAYATARAKFIAGVRDVIFPFGTFAMRVRYGVRCAEAPS